MTFADGAKAQDESAAILRRAGLVRMPDDARIEQGRRLERVFVEKIRADQATLRLVQFGMRLERIFHLRSARLEDLEQIPVTTFEIFEHFAQLLCGSIGIEPKNSANDMIGPDLVGRVEISGFSRRFEGSHHDPGGIGTQVQGLPVQELGLRQRSPLGSFAVRSRVLRDGLPLAMLVCFGQSSQRA